METLDKAIVFTSSRFDATSELPEDDNAGNRFYGRDVAAWLCERLAQAGLQADFLDEDWGWLVLGQDAPATRFEIAVYHFDGEAADAPEWGLWMRASRREQRFWRWYRTVKTALPPAVDKAVLDGIAAIGAHPRPWVDGPAG